MQITNTGIAAVFSEIADLLDIEDANPFRIRAYRNAARMLLAYPRPMADLIAEGFDLTTLTGIGDDLALKIEELVATGKLAFLDSLKGEVSPGLEALLKIPGLGPKRVHRLHEELGITSAEGLEKALKSGRVGALQGFGPKLQESITRALKEERDKTRRYRLADAEPVARELAQWLEQCPGVESVALAGSMRRKRETVKDIDIVVAAEKESPVIERFTAMADAQEVVMRGETHAAVALPGGMHADVRVVRKAAFITALHHFTGSKAHNVALRTMASRQGIKINEYGVFEGSKAHRIRTEADLYRVLGMPYIPPELRENRGEIEAALSGTLPDLLLTGQIRGDLHVHSSYSDGHESIENMALAAKERGYAYMAVTDHSKHLTVAHGLDEERLMRQMEEIDALNEKLGAIRILKSAEVDILSDGTLDIADEVLAQLDFAVCAVHYKFNLSKKEQTARIIKAVENPHCSILAHPTGRLIGLREGYGVDMAAIIDACRANGCILELNAQPDRLDIDDIHCKMAKEAGVKVALSTDAHSVNDFDLMEGGVAQARRGWLEKDDVVNTQPLKKLLKLLRR